MRLSELANYLDGLLEVGRFRDYAPNGLQVEGRAEVGRLVAGVTACQALIEAALAEGADAILVHHGYFWKGEDPRIRGIKRQRLRSLLASEISLLAYHLPLDAHAAYGNNVQLARVLGLEIDGAVDTQAGPAMLWHGRLPDECSPPALLRHVTHRLGRAPLHIPGARERIRTMAWCTGAAQDAIEDALALGADAYLTGEVSERTVHVAREAGIHFIAAGHHATERYGVRALAEHLGEKFDIGCRFIDIDNPV